METCTTRTCRSSILYFLFFRRPAPRPLGERKIAVARPPPRMSAPALRRPPW
jgi:hypothetical protein